MTTSQQGFVVEFPDPTDGNPLAPNLSAGFVYGDSCPPPFNQSPSAAGSGTGNFTITDALIIVGTTEYHGGTVTGPFSFLRAGTTVVFSGFQGQIATASGAVISTMSFLGSGSGQFVTLTPLGSCTLPVMNAYGVIAGVALQPV